MEGYRRHVRSYERTRMLRVDLAGAQEFACREHAADLRADREGQGTFSWADWHPAMVCAICLDDLGGAA